MDRRTCKHCGKGFPPVRRAHTFCSTRCKTAYHKEAARLRRVTLAILANAVMDMQDRKSSRMSPYHMGKCEIALEELAKVGIGETK